MNIDTNELKRILKIKREYDKGLIDIDMIIPEDYKVIKVLYDYETTSSFSLSLFNEFNISSNSSSFLYFTTLSNVSPKFSI